MTPELAVRLLLDYFEKHFMPGLVSLEPDIVESLRHCHCDVDLSDSGIQVRGRLPEFFNAVWRSANEGGANLPGEIHFTKCYRLFKRALDKELEAGVFRRHGFAYAAITGHQVRTHRIDFRTGAN